jgi:pimeloyl-ACP methyl ester carboxylesterase
MANNHKKTATLTKKHWFLIALLLAFGVMTMLFFILGLHRKPNFIQNFEEQEYGRDQPFIQPLSVADGLAVYAVGTGEPLLLFPYPHGHTIEPMAQGPLAQILSGLGRTVITFDVPGAYRSTREPLGGMDEMILAAGETLDRLDIQEPVDVIGHSMGGLAALAYAIERPERTRRLVLANSMSGFPAAARCGFPGSVFRPSEADYWRIIIWGMRINGGRADLALHKKLYNLMGSASFHDKTLFSPLEISSDDYEKGVPVRMIWSQNMYRRLSYAHRLGEVQAPTLILAGQHDPEASIACSQELLQGIAAGTLVIFAESGHAPFIEEAPRFSAVVGAFLNAQDESQ